MFNNLKYDLVRLRKNNKIPLLFVFLKSVILDNGFLAVVMYRFAHGCFRSRIPLIPSLIQRIAVFITGAEISFKACIGGGLRVAHGTGTVIGPKVTIGQNALILHGVTIGEGYFSDDDMPEIGDDVLIGAGAKILGNIRVGDRVKICANSVLVYSVPDGATMVGIPALPTTSKEPVQSVSGKKIKG